IFFWLSLAALFQPLSNSTGWLLITSGRGRALMTWGAFSTTITIIAFVVGVSWGPQGVAAAYFLSSAAKLPFLFRWSVIGTAVRSSDLYAAAAPAFITALVVWQLAGWLSPHLPLLPTLAILMVAGYSFTLFIHYLL